ILDVSRHRHRLSPLAFDPTDCFPSVRFFLRQIRDDQIGPFARKGDGYGPPNATVTAGDQGAFPRQFARAAVTLLSVIRLEAHFVFTPRKILLWFVERRF